MLALLITLFVALYILGPDLVSRWIVSLFAPLRVQTRSKSEEIFNALVRGLLPFLLAVWVTRHVLGLRLNGNGRKLWDLFWSLYDDKTAGVSREALFSFLPLLFHINELLLGVIYLTVLMYSVGLGLAILHYGLLLRKLEKWPKVAAVLVQLVRPWTAEWYLRLSHMLLPTKTAYIQVDVMTKADVLYRGRLEEHHLAADGSLVSITLKEPRKFKREELLEARKAFHAALPLSNVPMPNTESFWTPINGQFFVVMASDIMTLNVKYLDVASTPPVFAKTKVEAANKILAKIAQERESRSSASETSRSPSSDPDVNHDSNK